MFLIKRENEFIMKRNAAFVSPNPSERTKDHKGCQSGAASGIQSSSTAGKGTLEPAGKNIAVIQYAHTRGETMKKAVCVCMALAFAFFFAFVQSAASQEKGAPKLKKIPLISSDHVPPTGSANAWFRNVYFPKIQKDLAKVGYELDPTFYHAGSLYKLTDQVMACDQGLIDITIGVLAYEAARAPLHEILDFGFMGWDAQSLLKIWGELNANIPEFKAELANFKELYWYVPTPRWLHHNIKGARVPEDFKGKKIHASGPGGDMFRAIGAVPIKQNTGDWYTSLDRGLFDGVSVAFDMVGIMKLHEVLKYHMTFTGDNFGYSNNVRLMSRKKFDSLPKEVQKVFEDNFAWASETVTQDELSRLSMYQEGAKKKGNAFIQLTAEETAKWRAAAKPVQQKWVKEMEAKGLPGKKVYDEAVRLSQKYSEK
jgi:TRAP-type C4-dicarboxylate transport system substrate-binding protein